jgi:hypothetical protein
LLANAWVIRNIGGAVVIQVSSRIPSKAQRPLSKRWSSGGNSIVWPASVQRRIALPWSSPTISTVVVVEGSIVGSGGSGAAVGSVSETVGRPADTRT